MKIAKFTLISLAAMTLFTASVEAKFNFGGAARVGRDADKPLTSDLTYADLQSGKYKLSLKSGWDRNANGILFETQEFDGIKYVNICITKRLYEELSQREDFANYVFKAVEGGGVYNLTAPEHNLDGIEVKNYRDIKITDKNGEVIAIGKEAYIPMSVASGECKGVLETHNDGYSYCLADDLDDVFTKRSWF